MTCWDAMVISVVALFGLLESSFDAESDGDRATIEVGQTYPVIELPRYVVGLGSDYCGNGIRLGYSWSDHWWVEGEYASFHNHGQSFLLGGPRFGVRAKWVDAFVKLQPGMMRGVNGGPGSESARSKVVLSAGGAVVAGYSPRIYLRVDLGYLVMWYGDATVNRRSPVGPAFRPGTSGYPHWSVGVGLRF